MKSMSDASSEKQILLTETSAKQSGTKQRIGKLDEELPTLIENSKKTDESCHTASDEWKVRQTDRDHEKHALSEAIHYLKELSQGQKVLLQEVVSSPMFFQTRSVLDITGSGSETAVEAAATAVLMGDDEKNAAKMVQNGNFNGVKQVVSQLISNHKSTQKEEKEKREYCQTEIENKEDEKEETGNALAAVKASIEKKASEVEILSDEIKKLYGSIDNIRSSLDKAREVRK